MKHIHFIYGNQQLEIDEEVDHLIHSLQSEVDLDNSVFHFNSQDFFASDQSKSQKLLEEFQSTCETVSFFSPVIIVCLYNIQKIPLKKTPTEPIKKKLQEINFVKIPMENEMVWFDAETLTDHVETHHHITAGQFVTKIIHLGDKSFYIELDPAWKNRLIFFNKGGGQEAIQITEYLKNRLKGNISFEYEEEKIQPYRSNSNSLELVLKDYLNDHPKQVEFILTANIRNPREINKEIFGLLTQKSKIIKKTIAYDDFRPVSWIINRAEKKSLIFDDVAADLLIEIAGTDFSVLDMELTKLSILFQDNRKIQPEDLIHNVSHSKRFSVFRVTGFLVQKELKNSLECLEILLRDNITDAVSIFSLIVAQFRRLLKIAWMIDKGVSEKTIINSLKINPWIGKQIVQQVDNFTLRELENIIVHLSKCDLQIKYSAKEAITILENIFYQICQQEFKGKKQIDRHWLP